MYHVTKKILKYAGLLLLLLLGLFLLAVLLLQFPTVQNKVTEQITNSLSKSLNSKVSIKKVDIDFFKTIALEGIYIEDQQKDTLLYANRLSADIGLFSIFHKDILLNNIELDGATIKVARRAVDSTFNFDYLIQAFQPSSDTDTSTAPGWNFSLKEIGIQNTLVEYLDEQTNTQLKAKLTALTTTTNQLDFKEKIIDLELVEMQSSIVDYKITPFDKTSTIPINADNLASLAFPDIGWDISIQELDIGDNLFIYNNGNIAPKSLAGIDVNHLDISNINIQFKDFVWKDQQISIDLSKLSLVDKSGFQIDEMQTKLMADSSQIILENLVVNTPYSQFQNTSTLNYKDFADLSDFANNVSIESNFQQVNIAFHDLNLLAPALTNLQELNTNLNEYLYLDGKIQGKLNKLKLNDLNLKIGNKLTLNITGYLRNITDVEQAIFDIDLKKLSTSYDKVKLLTKNVAIPEGLKEFGEFTFSGKATGQIQNVRIEDFFLQTQSNTYIKGDALLTGLPDTKQLQFEVTLNSLATEASDWKGFLKNGVPPILDSLGNIQFIGKVNGDIRRFELVGDLNTDLGKLESNLLLNFNPDYSSGTYEGAVRLIDFELNRAFPNSSTQLGKASLRAKGQGSGFVLDSLIANAEVVIDSISFNDYTYREVDINGKFEQKNFDGHIELADKNAILDFNGSINLNDSIPDFSFVLDLDTLNLKPLNFTEKDLFIQFDAAIDFKGNSLDNITGESLISNFLIRNEVATYQEDSVVFSAKRPRLDSAHITLRSDFLQMDINGEFDIASLQNVALHYLEDYFPINNILTPKTRQTVDAAWDVQQNFSFDIEIKDPTQLTSLFVPQLTKLGETSIKGSFNRKSQLLDVEAIIDSLHFGGLETEQLVLRADGSPNKLTANLALLDLQSSVFAAPLVIFDTHFGEDSLRFKFKVTGDTLDKRLQIKGVAFDAVDWYEFKLTNGFVLNGIPWDISANNNIYFLDNYLFIDSLKVQSNTQHFAIQSEGFPKKGNSTPPITLSFSDFPLTDISNFLAIEQNTINGLLNGGFTLKKPFDNPYYIADLQVDDFTLNEEPVGQFYVNSEQSVNNQNIQLTAGIKGANNNLELNGNYVIEDKTFDVKGAIQEMELRLLNPITEDIISDSKGRASGDFTLSGTFEKPDLNGQLALEDANTIIDFLGTRIFIPEHSIEFNSNEIVLGNVAVKDVDGQTGTLAGNIKHQFFQDYILDLQFKSDAFQVLNTTAEQSPLFFGQLFVEATVDVTGELTLPTIEVAAKTLPNSVFNLQPLLESEEIATDEYIIFANREKYLQGSDTSSVAQYELQNTFNLDLSMDLDITPDVLVRIIIDPLTGDQVEGRGSSNMAVALSPEGDFNILGNFIIESGTYDFNYQNLLKKNFTIQPNSQINFVGDPLKSIFDITAIYETKTSTYELIKNEITDDGAEKSATQRRTDIKTLLFLNGLITQPAISFDIQLGKGTSASISSSVGRKLDELRNDQDEMNKQVFALLLFNSFIASDNTGISLAGTGQDVALSSVSKLVSNELNKLADKYLSGFELSFDLGNYKSTTADDSSSAIEVGIGLSKKLFNDRIRISANADVDLNAQSSTTETGSNIVGDFVLEYQLTESGSYLLRVFRLNDFDILTDQNTARNGVGINYRKVFGKALKNKKN